MKKIRVDFNRRGRKGYVVSSTRRASEPLMVDDVVDVYQPGEAEMELRARVVSISSDGRVELDVIWEPMDVLALARASSPLYEFMTSNPSPKFRGTSVGIKKETFRVHEPQNA